MFVWTEQAVAELKRLWSEGGTGTTIGDRFGVSRNAAIGKLWRLGLRKGKPKPKLPKAVKPKNNFAFKRLAARPDVVAAYARRKEQRRRIMAEMALPSEGLAEFGTSHVCAFPMWPDNRQLGNLAELIVCGRERVQDRSYCSAHCRLVYQPKPERAAA